MHIVNDGEPTRQAIVEAAQRMNALGINQGTSGNIAVRDGARMLITPSGIPYEAMRPEQIASLALDDDTGAAIGPLAPSTEWRFHRGILRGRADVNAVVHTHAPACTTLSILRRDIPPVHYMMAAFGGDVIRCAPYATFGTQELADHALAALGLRRGCLLANHGMIVAGKSLEHAMWLAVELETLAAQYLRALAIGEPVLLTAAEMRDATRAFAGYGPTQ